MSSGAPPPAAAVIPPEGTSTGSTTTSSAQPRDDGELASDNIDILSDTLLTENDIYNCNILIIGGGPTGLGAAKRLDEVSKTSVAAADWLLLEGSPEVGGLASTLQTKEGFYFDVGGHVVFSHYQYFDSALDEALPDKEADWNHHLRTSFVRITDSWVPYPFQNNIASLPAEEANLALQGLISAHLARQQPSFALPRNFDSWILSYMGPGIANLFMRPYNTKLWTVSPVQMQCSWLGERVAVPNLSQIQDLLQHSPTSNDPPPSPCTSWGPNATFRFPVKGGTGGIWKAVAATLPRERLKTSTSVVSIDTVDRVVKTACGKAFAYKELISTMPLDQLCGILSPARPDLEKLASQLTHTTTHVIGVGIRGTHHPDRLKSANWMYFPEDNAPFYRATVFSKYAEGNVPDKETLLPTLGVAGNFDWNPELYEDCQQREASPGPYWSLMFEIARRPSDPPEDVRALVNATVLGALATTLLAPSDEIVSVHHARYTHGYPVPTLERDKILDTLLPSLSQLGIRSRGRFGAWKYEVSNQDHSFMQGVEAVDSILFGTREVTLEDPEAVNARGEGNRARPDPDPAATWRRCSRR